MQEFEQRTRAPSQSQSGRVFRFCAWALSTPDRPHSGVWVWGALRTKVRALFYSVVSLLLSDAAGLKMWLLFRFFKTHPFSSLAAYKTHLLSTARITGAC
jgi:hypothetical protein